MDIPKKITAPAHLTLTEATRLLSPVGFSFSSGKSKQKQRSNKQTRNTKPRFSFFFSFPPYPFSQQPNRKKGKNRNKEPSPKKKAKKKEREGEERERWEEEPAECDQWWRCWGNRLPSWAASASGAAAFLSLYIPLYVSLSHSSFLYTHLSVEQRTEVPRNNSCKLQSEQRLKGLKD